MESELISTDDVKERNKYRELVLWPVRRLRVLLRDDARRHRVLFVSGVTVLGAVSTLAYLTYRMPHLPFDLATTLQLQRATGAPVMKTMVAISLPGYMPWVVVLIGAGCIVVGRWLTWKAALFLGALSVIEGLVNLAIKTAIGRPRPTSEFVDILFPSGGHSFPSGHVMLYTVFFGFLFFLIWVHMRRSPLRTLLLIVTGTLTFLVGPSRIYLGAHWLSDVVAGYLVGLIILLFGVEFYIKYVLVSPEES